MKQNPILYHFFCSGDPANAEDSREALTRLDELLKSGGSSNMVCVYGSSKNRDLYNKVDALKHPTESFDPRPDVSAPPYTYDLSDILTTIVREV